MVLVAPLLLPGYDTPQGGPSGGPGREQFMLGLRVGPSSHRVKGSTIQGAGLRHLKGVYLVALRRGADVVHAVDPTMQLEERDVLYFTGQTEYVQALAKDYQLEFVSEALEGGNVQGTLMGVPGPRRPRRPSPFAAAAAAAGVDQVGMVVVLWGEDNCTWLYMVVQSIVFVFVIVSLPLVLKTPHP